MNRGSTLISAVWAFSERVGTALRWLSPTIARLTVGLVFFQSGWGKLHDLEKVTGYFTELGIPNPALQARFASTAEFVCGGLLLLGLATRFAVVPLFVTMCVAIRNAQWEKRRRDWQPGRPAGVLVHRAARMARHRRPRTAIA
jgi:uncharacterized membrane protein YphA (DoxX/SURF4 family)